ncbi:hypothetical protein N7532_006638 [Penicillium argentinense]|uniref:DHHA2 domain-containing protein n=1 Tax=Penicillium argentinense TaxID=1131581 RepID=A0A9W9FGM4_9EURO|nr:uncharacterized protein N7532_006638 [Penicillium argentinense]KAJ5099637.1 hypothetical protein N7532_006638 [Penicillium argentinense]
MTLHVMTLLQFLRLSRQVHLAFLAGKLTESPIYVLGNPSADLDSIISAIVYSYCASNRLPATKPRPHVPLLNLPNVSAGPELYRLRPEFVTALWLSTNFPALKPDERFENASESAGKLLREHILTVADFAQSLRESSQANKLVADVTMVDWNAMPIRDQQKGTGSVSGLGQVSFRTVGCIDHHVDEGFVPSPESLPKGQPVVIQVGPGSCSSLITDELEKRGLWNSCQEASSEAEIAQVAKLTLAPMLIDTTNLTAEGKVTDVDVRSVDFLRQKVTPVDAAWDMEAFYEVISDAKKNSLDLLTLQEVLDRDYKEWAEKTQSSERSLNIGFCSSVKPIRWVIEKAGGCEEFLQGVRTFGTSEGKWLDIVVVMTHFTSPNNQHSRELFVCVTGQNGLSVKGVNAFVDQSGAQLKLSKWTPLDGECVELNDEEIRSTLDGDTGLWSRIWVQANSTASRKQVAPMLREAVAKL